LFVTHNPELTRYATRVVYMHDGAIVHDEQTAIGEIAATARKVMYTIPTKTVDDDLAGVSTLMKHVPQDLKSNETDQHRMDHQQSQKASSKTKPKSKRAKTRKTKGGEK